jgi:phosphatidate cytidylyltransferase
MSATESKGGRSLSQSIIFGLILAGAFLLSVLIIKELFVVLAALACAAGAWEISTALRIKNWYVARVPVAVGSAAMLFFTYYGGERMQWISAWVIIAALMIWRGVQLLIQRKLLNRTFRETVRDFSAAAFVVVYLPLTMSFAILLLREPAKGNHVDGKYWVITFAVSVILSDTMGYLIGRRFGKRRLAAKVSPKKSLEGLAASILFGGASGVILTVWLLGLPWWYGMVVAAFIILGSVLGDLSESLIKRDLGVKDMSSWIPGHGGVMDRLDSMLPAALIAYLLMLVAVRIFA